MAVGTVFKTGNSTVAKLAPGTVLEIVGVGQVRVVSVPKPVFNVGDRVYVKSKGRYGRIFRATTNGSASVAGMPPAGYQFYVSDDAPYVIRQASEADLQKL